jgi:hypothetical protein
MCTQGFDLADHNFLRHFMKDKFLIESRIKEYGLDSYDRPTYTLIIDEDQLKKIFESLNYIFPKSMIYKISSKTIREYDYLNDIMIENYDQSPTNSLKSVLATNNDKFRAYCNICKEEYTRSHFEEYHYSDHECSKCGIFFI